MHTPDPTHRPRRSAFVTLAIVAALFVAACGATAPSAGPTASATPLPSATTTPTATPSGSAVRPSASVDPAADAAYDAIEDQVARIRGLKATRPVERQIISEAELRSMITEQFDKETPPEYLAANERLYKALGLIPAGTSLRDLTLDLLGGGVVGFYRDDEGKLYVVSKTGAPGANERFFFAHEYDHALQDQNFTVFKDQDGILDQGDRILARQAVYEGDGVLTMTQWAAANLTPGDLREIIAASADPEVAALLARTPAILRTPLEFPYTTGFTFVGSANTTGGWDAVNDLYKRMPESTEQILHPEKYAAAEAPVKVAMPSDLATRLGAGWTVPLQDTFGELQTGIWLREGRVASDEAEAAAAGWGGDRLAVMEGPDGAWAVAMQSAWDTTADAAAFEAAARTAVEKARGVAQVLPGDAGKTRWVIVADDRATFGLVTNALGLAG